MDMDTFLCLVKVKLKTNGFTAYYGGGDRGVVASCSMRLGHLVFVLQYYQNGATPLSASKKVMKGDMVYSKLSHDITQVIEEKHL
jgi:hypothetical protein